MSMARLAPVSKNPRYLIPKGMLEAMRAGGVDASSLGKSGYKDMYLNGSEVEIMLPEFGGGAAEAFGYTTGREVFKPEHYMALYQGEILNPELKHARLADEANASKTKCYEIDLSFNKSISMEALIANPGRRAEILNILRDANQMMMREVEKLAYARVRNGGSLQFIPVKLAHVSFTHSMARFREVDGKTVGGDMHLHVHNQFSRFGLDDSGVVRNIEIGLIFAKQHELSMKTDSYIIQRLRSIGIEPKMNMLAKNHYDSWEVAGYDRNIIDAFSAGRQDILAEQRERGVNSNMDAERSLQEFRNKVSRLAKSSIKMEIDERDAYWRMRCAELGVDLDALARARDAESMELAGQRAWQAENFEAASTDRPNAPRSKDVLSQGRYALTASEAVKRGVEHLLQNRMTFKEHQLIQAALLFSGHNLTYDEITAEIDAQCVRGDIEVRVTNYDPKKHRDAQSVVLVPKEAKRVEKHLRQLWTATRAGNSKGLAAPIATLEMVRSSIAAFEAQMSEAKGRAISLSQGQRNLVEMIATTSNRVVLGIGDAGTGKSTAMRAVKQLTETLSESLDKLNQEHQLGYKIVGLAPSGTARNAIAESILGRDGNFAETTQRALADPRFWERIDEQTILIIDEVGLVHTRGLETLLSKATSRGARVVLIGDHKQFKSVEAGSAASFLLQIEREYCKQQSCDSDRVVRLSEMQRARTAELRSAHFGARDNPRETVLNMVANDQVKILNNRDSRLSYLADRYAALPSDERELSYIVTTTNADRVKLNELTRDRLGLVGGHKVTAFSSDEHTTAARQAASTYETGSYVRLNSRIHLSGRDRAKGTILQVDGVRDDGVVRLKSTDSNEWIYMDPRKHGQYVSVGDYRTIEIAEGEVLRLCGKITCVESETGEELVVTNGSRLVCRTIDQQGRQMIADHINDGHTTRLLISLDDPSLSLRHGYACTGHSMQGHTMDERGLLLLDLNNQDLNSLYTNISRSTVRMECVTDQKTSSELRAMVRRAGNGTATDFATLRNQSRASNDPLVLWAPPAVEQKTATRDSFILLDKDASHELIAQRMLEAQNRWGSFVLSGSLGWTDEEGRRHAGQLRDAAEAVAALESNGHKINIVADPIQPSREAKAVEKALQSARAASAVSIGSLDRAAIEARKAAALSQARDQDQERDESIQVGQEDDDRERDRKSREDALRGLPRPSPWDGMTR